MSLVQHVSAIDGVDREPEPDGDATYTTEVASNLDSLAPIRRKISYDILPQSHPETGDKQATPAYKVSNIKRFVQVVITVLACSFASGIVFGFAALKPILVEEGVYRSLCTEEELQHDVGICHKQDMKLNLFFTIGSITANVSALPVGTILDRFGSRMCGFAGCCALTIGCLLMSASFSWAGFDGYIVGNFFLALGGTFIFVPSFQIANAFPRYIGTIVALVTGAFDASAAMYLFYRLLYKVDHQTFGPKWFYLAYLTVPALIFVSLLIIMPTHDYQSSRLLYAKIEKAEDATRDVHDSDEEIESDGELRRIRDERAERRRVKIRKINNILGDESERKQREHQEEERQVISSVWGILHGQPAQKQMVTPWFILIALMTVLQMLRMNYFIATIRSQYLYMLDSELQAERLNHFFDIALPVGGVISTPFIGLILGRLSVPATLATIVLFTTGIGVLNSVPAVWAGYMNIALFVLLRPLYYSAMSDYATKVFGFATFGRIYGAIICVSGLANFSQYGLDALTHGPLQGNPIPVNIFLAGVGFIVGTALVAYVYFAGKSARDRQHELIQEEERRRLIEEDWGDL
ncbi:uncharacterized protein ATNIH1004_000266 [Aspergillus tanneri]|uniref:Major facilitator superfamily (MFS) profile domain-containing protein n=1 Tax=Aspergillus tanneri TaxID=1220188 RepID=A0A5M9N195_9EURO|nr:uncharacterized protein ATNIH1004_000266 [Aspergillus tanneri]KAA8651384.1 hypothetical protein ATNIH1004_000266 [Aspergillus tanneri]